MRTITTCSQHNAFWRVQDFCKGNEGVVIYLYRSSYFFPLASANVQGGFTKGIPVNRKSSRVILSEVSTL